MIARTTSVRLALQSADAETPLPVRYEFEELKRGALDVLLFDRVRETIATHPRTDVDRLSLPNGAVR